MKVHFREKYGAKGEEILYVTPAGKFAQANAHCSYGLSTCVFAGVRWLELVTEFFLLFEIPEQEGVVRVPLTRVSAGDKPLIDESFLLYRIFKSVFLPQGYPDSVSEDYIHYQFWDTIQAFCSTISGKSCMWWRMYAVSMRLIFLLRFLRYTIDACDTQRCWCGQWCGESVVSNIDLGMFVKFVLTLIGQCLFDFDCRCWKMEPVILVTFCFLGAKGKSLTSDNPIFTSNNENFKIFQISIGHGFEEMENPCGCPERHCNGVGDYGFATISWLHNIHIMRYDINEGYCWCRWWCYSVRVDPTSCHTLVFLTFQLLSWPIEIDSYRFFRWKSGRRVIEGQFSRDLRQSNCFIRWRLFALGHHYTIVRFKNAVRSEWLKLIHLFVHSVLYGLFFASILIHIIANIRAVKAIRLRSFNESRYLIALEEFFRSGRVMSVATVNELERVTVGQ